MLGFSSVPVARNFMENRGGGGLSRLSFEFSFLSHCYEKFRRGTILCFVSHNFR